MSQSRDSIEPLIFERYCGLLYLKLLIEKDTTQKFEKIQSEELITGNPDITIDTIPSTSLKSKILIQVKLRSSSKRWGIWDKEILKTWINFIDSEQSYHNSEIETHNIGNRSYVLILGGQINPALHKLQEALNKTSRNLGDKEIIANYVEEFTEKITNPNGEIYQDLAKILQRKNIHLTTFKLLLRDEVFTRIDLKDVSDLDYVRNSICVVVPECIVDICIDELKQGERYISGQILNQLVYKIREYYRRDNERLLLNLITKLGPENILCRDKVVAQLDSLIPSYHIFIKKNLEFESTKIEFNIAFKKRESTPNGNADEIWITYLQTLDTPFYNEIRHLKKQDTGEKNIRIIIIYRTSIYVKERLERLKCVDFIRANNDQSVSDIIYAIDKAVYNR